MGPAAIYGLQMAGGAIQGAMNDARQVRQQRRLNDINYDYYVKTGDYNYKQQMKMWHETGYGAQVDQMNEAGINPGLLYGMSGGGGQTTGSQGGQSGGSQAPAGGGEFAAAGQMALQLGLLKAQKENIEADTRNKEADTLNKPIQGKNITADTENKTLQSIILKYGGQEAERQWTINKELTAPEYGAKADELEARSAVANQVIKLHEDGTMQRMTEAELNNKLKEIGLKNLQIDGKKLENAILELEKEMQTKLGLDKGSPGWLKMIGRLILGFTK